MYRYRDPNPEIRMNSPAYIQDNLQRSLGGYVRYSLSEFPISALLYDNSNPFPLASAISLNYYVNDNDDEPSDFYFQPYHTNVSCFTNIFGVDATTAFPLRPNSTTERFPYFRESAWNSFTNVFKIDPHGNNHSSYRLCVNETYPCK